MFSAFLIASVVLAVTPGPGVLFLVYLGLQAMRAPRPDLTGGSFIGLGVYTVGRD